MLHDRRFRQVRLSCNPRHQERQRRVAHFLQRIGDHGQTRGRGKHVVLQRIAQKRNVVRVAQPHQLANPVQGRQIRKKRGNKIAMVFQNPLTALNPVFTVGEQIAMVLRVYRGMGRKEAMQYAGKLLEQVGIASYRVKDYPNQFSGGMRQRVGIAAAIACSPELLIADEPTTALDVTIQAQILELMKELQTRHSTSLLMITHNLGIISELCQKVAVMYAGRIIEYGTVAAVFRDPLHPYTRGLLGALPNLEGPRERLVAIPGKMADSQNLPSGCFFHPRCEETCGKCGSEQPAMCKISDDHYVACFNAEGRCSNG